MFQPTYEQLIAFAAGNLSADETRAVAAYVQDDAQASAIVRAWQMVHGLVASDDSVAPSPAALIRARSLFEARAPVPHVGGAIADWIGAVDRFMARMVYDSRLQPALVRDAADDRVLLTYETDAGDIDLRAERLPAPDGTARDDRWRMMGQISETGGGPREVALIAASDGSVVASALSDAYGAFVLEIASGDYELLIHGQRSAAILVSPLILP